MDVVAEGPVRIMPEGASKPGPAMGVTVNCVALPGSASTMSAMLPPGLTWDGDADRAISILAARAMAV